MAIGTAKQYAARIRAAMNYTGIRRDELAARMGIAPGTMSRKMAHPDQFTAREMYLIAKIFAWKTVGGEGEY